MFINRMLVLTTCLLSIATQAQEKPRLISVSGSATINVAPNEVTVNFDLHTFDKDLKKSKELNDEQSRSVLKLIKSLGVEDKDIQTDSMRTSAVYEELVDHGYRKDGELRGYNTNRNYSVILKDVKKFASLTDELLVNPAVSLGRYQFRHSEMRKYRDEARRKAVQAAKEKASLLAAELGCKPGMPYQISELQSAPAFNITQNNYVANSVTDGNAVESDAESPTRLGEIVVSAEVDISFDLLPQ